MLAFIELENRVPPDHPLQTIKALIDQTLVTLSQSSTRCNRRFDGPPFHRSGCLRPCCSSPRSERVFCEELDNVLLFRWFLDKNLAQPSFDATIFKKIISVCWITELGNRRPMRWY